jgi:hypothetical protein
MAWRSVGMRSAVPPGIVFCGGAFVIVLVAAVAVSIVLAFTCVNEWMNIVPMNEYEYEYEYEFKAMVRLVFSEEDCVLDRVRKERKNSFTSGFL